MSWKSGEFSPAPRRVVVTGAGILTAHGAGWRVNADGFRSGRAALRPVTLFDVSRQRVQTAGEVLLPDALPPHFLTVREVARLERGGRFLLHAAAETLACAGWEAPHRFPLVLGTSAGAMTLGEAFYETVRHSPGRRRGQTTRALCYQTQHQAAAVARGCGLDGPSLFLSNACASGANAIGHAFQLIRHARAERVLCGGYDALCRLVFAGFDSLKALSPTVPRPFDAHRDGLALGEGAGLLALEDRDAAVARGAEILAEISGYGMATDVHHLTQPHPEGEAALASMTAACRMAGLTPGEIGYINSHGTGTPLNDVAEGHAIQRWAGEATPRIAVSSTKGAIGHLLGGAGAVEAVICVMALREGFLPPNTGVLTPDPVCTFDLVREARSARPRHVLTNSFGFGGSNATLIFSAP